MKKSASLLTVLAVLTGSAAGYWLTQRAPAEQGQTTTADPYGQLGTGPLGTGQLGTGPLTTPPPRTPAPSSAPVPARPPATATPAPTPRPTPAQNPAPGSPPPVAALPADFRLPVQSAAVPGPLPPNPRPHNPDSWYALGRTLSESGDHRRAAAAFAQAAALNPSAANWRALADEYAALGQYAPATRAYARAARHYRQTGDEMTARALEHLAAPFRQTAELQLVVSKVGATQPALARFEPPRGVLLGVHVAGDGVQGDGVQGGWGNPGYLTARYRPFAVAFRYWKLSRSADPAVIFPGRFAGAVRESGAALHLALEPGMPLADISDATIHAFAAQAKAAGLPIFVRFASEMNDPHNDWSRDPALYRRTFRRVAHILHAQAPNVAMVWMPMPGDLDTITPYYPGPDAVDWAGLSLYSVPFENGDVTKPQLTAHPLDVLDGFYRVYSPRHPIQLSEYAASNRSGAAPGRDFSAFAAQQLRETYWGAWMKYPRLKNINWLDLDMHTDPLVRRGPPERQNDYRLFANEAKWRAFRQVTQEKAFFQSFSASQCRTCAVDTARPWPPEVQAAQTGITGQLWLQTAQSAAGVKLLLNGKELAVEQTLPHRFRLPPLASGKHLLTVRVLDGAGKVLLEENRLFVAK